MRKLAEEAQLEPDKTEGILQGSVDLGGDPRESHSTTGAGHFELVSAKLKPMDFGAHQRLQADITGLRHENRADAQGKMGDVVSLVEKAAHTEENTRRMEEKKFDFRAHFCHSAPSLVERGST